jgi:hypothetical protein
MKPMPTNELRKIPLKEKEAKKKESKKSNQFENTTMKPTSILNRQLQKPWLLISCYDVSFDNYISIQNRVERLCKQISDSKTVVTAKLQETVSHLQQQLAGISQQLKTLDEMIHDYIKSHQQ